MNEKPPRRPFKEFMRNGLKDLAGILNFTGWIFWVIVMYSAIKSWIVDRFSFSAYKGEVFMLTMGFGLICLGLFLDWILNLTSRSSFTDEKIKEVTPKNG